MGLTNGGLASTSNSRTANQAMARSIASIQATYPGESPPESALRCVGTQMPRPGSLRMHSAGAVVRAVQTEVGLPLGIADTRLAAGHVTLGTP